MEPNGKLHGKLEERKANSEKVMERELELKGEKIAFIGNGVEIVKIEEGIIKVEPSEAGSTIFISKNVAQSFQVRIANNNLWLTNEDYSLEMEDSIEKGRVIEYQIDEEEEMDEGAMLLEDEEYQDDQEVKEMSVSKNGEYQVGKGKLKVEGNGYKLVLTVEDTKLVIEGFGEERKLRYLETVEEGFGDFAIDIKSQKEVNAAKRDEVLIEFQKIADEINGDKHGLAKGITRILNDNNVPVVYQ